MVSFSQIPRLVQRVKSKSRVSLEVRGRDSADRRRKAIYVARLAPAGSSHRPLERQAREKVKKLQRREVQLGVDSLNLEQERFPRGKRG